MHRWGVPEILIERTLLALGAAAYLFWFRTEIPSGDALVYIRHLGQGLLVFNPNHLLMDPIAYFSSRLLASVDAPISAVAMLKWISGLSAVASLLAFHMLLLELRVGPWLARAAAVLALFGSRNFLSMAVSEEFFMVQMPVLLFVLVLCIRALNGEGGTVLQLYFIGVLMAVVTAISIHNLFLLAGLGVFFARFTQAGQWRIQGALRIWGGAALVGLPVFLVAHQLSGTSTGFVHWLMAYQGTTENPLGELYGVGLSLPGITESGARLAFGLLANFMDAGGLGTVLKSWLLLQPLEFLPDRLKTTVGIVLLPVVGFFLIVLTLRVLRGGWRLPVVRLSVVWVASYLVFNFLWNDSSDQFWMQVLPVFWMLFLVVDSRTSRHPSIVEGKYRSPSRNGLFALAVAAPLLLLFNTWQVVTPLAFIDLQQRSTEHSALLRDGDLEIMPGWDGLKWIAIGPDGPAVEQVSLMELALKGKDNVAGLASLPARIERQLDSGHRVLVARLYDLDSAPNPWYGLAQLGWPRTRIQQLLSRFCTREAGRVGDAVFREVYACTA